MNKNHPYYERLIDLCKEWQEEEEDESPDYTDIAMEISIIVVNYFMEKGVLWQIKTK